MDLIQVRTFIIKGEWSCHDLCLYKTKKLRPDPDPISLSAMTSTTTLHINMLDERDVGSSVGSTSPFWIKNADKMHISFQKGI